ncbi:MAG: translation initiation factor IF-6 [Candidatus Bathyarchaeia archaeon]
MTLQIDILGNPSIGLYFLSLDTLCLVPPGIPPRRIKAIEEELKVPAYQSTIAGSSLLGVLAAGNNRGIAVPYIIRDEERRGLEEKLPDAEVSVLDCKWTALGNMILVNDRGCLVDPRLPSRLRRELSDLFGVEVQPGTIGGLTYVGSLAVATNKGAVTSPLISEEERGLLEDLLKVESEPCTVNGGLNLPKCGLTANVHGVLVGSTTLGHELAILTRALGL